MSLHHFKNCNVLIINHFRNYGVEDEFGWLLAADMGLAYYLVPRLCGVKLWSEKLGVAKSILWNIIIISAIFSLLGGYQKAWNTLTCRLLSRFSLSSPGSCSVSISSPR